MDFLVGFFSQEAWSWVIGGLLGLGGARLIRWWRRKSRQLDARSAFGAVASGNDIVIELARWSLRRGPRDQPRLYISFPGRDSDLYGPDDLAAVGDVEVASVITEATVDAYGTAPVITSVAQGKQDSNVTIICVGSSLVNPRVASLLDGAGPDFPVRFVELAENDDSGAAICIEYLDELGQTNRLHSDATSDYAIVARFPRPGGTYDFIVGGIHAEGTIGAGEWLRQNWRRFHEAAPRSGALLKVDRLNKHTQPEEMATRGLTDGQRVYRSIQKMLRPL